MLLSKTVEIKWNSKIKKHYVDLGYKYTKMGEPFTVDVNDLTSGSNVLVDVICDYCGIAYKKEWHRYYTENTKTTIHKDCCNKCKKHKIVDTSMAKYGVNSVLSLSSIKQKIEETNLERYGARNPFSSDIIKERISETNIKKYGVQSPLQSEKIMKKVQDTCIERYGAPSYIQTLPRKIGEDSPRWKGGVEYHRVERATFEYHNWRKSVFDRDLYTCKCCGDRNGNGHAVKLCAHHIKNWKDFPDERYDVNNGIALCESCHIKFHSIYGKKLNNDKQLKEFLNLHGKKIC